ncbi:MAG: magnesium chelatase subunit D [Chitinophagales bacterium]|nr:magnesium chelatase subunit D [Hyphomicrobiales bacterium]
MTDDGLDADYSPWALAASSAALFAVDPSGLGVALRAAPGPVRDSWLQSMRTMLPASAPVLRMPLNISDERLLGGIDLSASLNAGRLVASRGLLADADGGVLVVAMAERLGALPNAVISAAVDFGEVALEREGLVGRSPAHFGVVALDEGVGEDESSPASLMDRLAFHIDLSTIAPREAQNAAFSTQDIAAARARLDAVTVAPDLIEGFCATAMALGVQSLRAPLLALKAARAAAALAGHDTVDDDDAALAVRLVLSPRATQTPVMESAPEAPEEQPQQPAPEEQSEPPPENQPKDEAEGDKPEDEDMSGPLEDLLIAAAIASIPQGLLERLAMNEGRPPVASAGKAGALRKADKRGRPSGVRSGEPRGGARLNIVETLRAAAPWQTIRRRSRAEQKTLPEQGARLEIRRDDFRVTRYKERSETLSIFVVDASGSLALNRLAEAKGAVELLLAEAYVRRDQVALIAFRGKGAEMLLPPTRSLTRAKRSLASLPGGGGTPLAAALDAAGALADAARRKGQTPTIIMLTDGRANIARDGSAGRGKAGEDAIASAHMIRAAGFAGLLIDTSPQAAPQAGTIATAMGARYLALPYADAATLSRAARAVL